VAAVVLDAWRSERGGHPLAAEIEEVLHETCALATDLIGRWLATGRAADAAERRRLAATAQLPADEQISLTELAKCYLGWRDATVVVVRREGSSLGVDARQVARATAMVRRSCDASLVEMVREFDVQRRLLKDNLAAGYAQLAAVVDTTPAALLLMDGAERLVRWNRAAEELFGLPPHGNDDAPPKPLHEAVPGGVGEEWAWVAALGARAWAGENLRDESATWTRPDGTVLALSVSTAPVRPSVGEETGVLAVVTDVSARQRLEAQLRRQALTDELTGLANRTLFTDRLEHALAARPDQRGVLAVLLIDLDGFKAVNDTGGHHAGDLLLHEAAARMSSAVRRGDTVARLGGDEFGVLLERTTAEGARTAAAAVLEAVRTTAVLPGGTKVAVSGSIGLATLDQGCSAEVEQMLADADLAMYEAKREGGNRVSAFDPAMRAAISDRLTRESELRAAVEPERIDEQIVVHYQPYVDLAAGDVVGMEALVRWAHPVKGLLPPGEFIGLAESTGLIVPLGRHVLATAAAQTRAWQQLRRRTCPDAAPLSVSVNVSVRQLADSDLLSTVSEVLSTTGLPAFSLTLELTESVLATDDPRTVALLHQLQELGVRLAVDDFGTGYSALSYLQRFPLDVLKVDRSFVSDLPDPGARPLVASVVSLAHSLGLATVAEGVETADQADVLRELGCGTAQGYYFARPLPAADLTALLQAEVAPGPAAPLVSTAG
jgi:diguanylate cyclase (GGDEF)-like protein/PAS domain S-box-containing protein